MKDARLRVWSYCLAWSLLCAPAQSATLSIGTGAAYDTLAAAYAAARPGDVLEIADDRTYNESLSILKADLTLRAAPGASPTIRGKGAGQGAAVFVAADGVTIEGLTLDGIDRTGRVIATLAPTRLTIRDNRIRNGDYGIFALYTAGDAPGLRIERNDLSANNTDIWLHNVSGGRVADNRVHSNSGTGIGLGGYSAGVQVVGNEAYADLPPTQLRSRSGILVSGDDNLVEHNEVHGNVQGIVLSASTGNRVAHNRVSDNSAQNFSLSGAHDNRLDGNLDFFTGVPFKGGLSILLANASRNLILQHSSIGAGRGVWFTQTGGASRDNNVRDSLFRGDPVTGKYGLDATTGALTQTELDHLAISGFRIAVGAGLAATHLNGADPRLTADYHLAGDSWALSAGSAGQPVGATGTGPQVPSNRELDSVADLNAFTAVNTPAAALTGGLLTLSDPQDQTLRDAGLIDRADLPGDLDVILEYRDQALPNPGYQATLALMLVGPDYQWASDQPVARLTHRIHDTSDWSWHDFTQPGGPNWYYNHSGRLQSGLLRLTRQSGLIRAYAWNTDHWQALAGSALGVASGARLRVGVRMLNNWNDDYAVQIERIQVQSDADGDGLLDAEEEAIGTFPDLADSDADGTPDGADLSPRDARTGVATPAPLVGTAAVRLDWYRAPTQDLFIVARNLTGADATLDVTLDGLGATGEVVVPLEATSLPLTAGHLTDTLPSFGRRLYRLPAGVSHLYPAPPAAPLVQPRQGPWTLDLSRYVLDLYGAEVLRYSLMSSDAGLSASLSGSQLTLTPTGEACGTTTLRFTVVNGLDEQTLVDLPLRTLGSAGPNLITNGGFEQVGNTAGQIPGWTYGIWSGASQLDQDTLALEGQHAARLQGLGTNKAAIRQTLTLPPGRYRLSARVASWDLKPGEYNQTSLLYLTGVGASDLSLKLVSGDRDWSVAQQVFTLTQTRSVTLYFFIYGPGYLWVDDVRLQTLEPCASDPDGGTLLGPTGDALGFLPPVTVADRVLQGYCGDPGMAATRLCQRLAGIDPASLAPPRAAAPLTLAAFAALAPVGDTARYLDLTPEVAAAPDWSGYDYLEIRLTNPGASTLKGIVEIRDRQATDYWSRVNWYTEFVPGEQVIRIPLQVFVGEKSVIKQRRRLDVTAITRLFVDVLEPGQVFVQDVRLTLEPPYRHDFARLIKLDPGTDTSPVMFGFTALTTASGYRPEYGFGLRNTPAALRAEDRRHPDDLLRDWISIPSGELAVDLPNGRYHVWLMLEDPGYWEYVQNYDWRSVSAEGAVKYQHVMSADNLWARIFANAATQDLPGDDAWQRYIPTRYQPVEFTVEVADGQLNLGFAAGSSFTYANTLSALLIWPAAQEAQGQAFVAELWERLRAHFDTEYVQTLPATAPHPVPGPESAPGLLVFQRHFDQDIQATDIPQSPELVDILALDLARGEFEPLTVGLYAKTNLTLTRAELTLPGLATQSLSVRTKFRRTAPGGVRYTALPHLLDDLALPLELPANQSRRLWFVVQAPADAQETEIQGSLLLGFANGSQVTLPVIARVAPFVLPPADIPFGWLGALPNYPSSAFPGAVDARAVADLGPSLQLAQDHAMTSFSGGRGGPAVSGSGAGGLLLDFSRFDSVMGAAAGAFPFAPLSYGGLAPSGGLGFEGYAVTDTQSRYGKPYAMVLAEVLGAVRAHVAARGWAEPVYTVGDEPGEAGIPQVIAFADAIRTAGSKTSVFTSFTSTTEPKAALGAHVDQVYLSHHSAAALQAILDQGHDCGTYNLGGRYARGIYQFLLRSLGCRAGFYQFAFNSTHGDLYYPLDGREDDLVAALPTATAGRLLPTLDAERLRESIDDFRYLLALEQALEDPRDAQAAAEARAWLDGTLEDLRIGHLELADPPLDDAGLDALRAVARHYILAIRGLAAP
jgi:parallel beta-helix repeat protein